MNILIYIFSGIGYLSVGFVIVAVITDTNILMKRFFHDKKRKSADILFLVMLVLWPISGPLMLIVIGLNRIILKRYKKKYKNIGQLKKIMARKDDKIYDFYCEQYNL
jgi:transposase